MRLAKLSCLLLFAACSSRTGLDFDEFDGGPDASADRATGGSGGTGQGGRGGGSGGKGGNQGGSGGTQGGTGGVGGFGATGGGGSSKGGSGGVAGTGATGGKGGVGGTGMGGGGASGGTGGSGATGGTGGSGGSGARSGTGGVGGQGGRGGSGATGGVGGVGGTGGSAGTAGRGGTGGFAGIGGSAGSGGFAGSAGFGGAAGYAGSFDGGWGGFAGSFRPPDAGPGQPIPPWNDPTCPSGNGSPLLGTWVGYVENHKFSSGSDVLHLTVRGADASSLCGSMTFGDTTPLPPPTDPDIGYPPNADLTQWMPNGLPIERFAHTLFSGLVSGKRVRFHTMGFEPWKSWCAMQKSYLLDPWAPLYSCMDAWGWQDSSDAGPSSCWTQDPNTGQTKPVDCGKMYNCSHWRVCACNQSGCGADDEFPIDFDAQFEGGEGRGSIVLYTQNGTQVFNVYLTKTD